MNKEQALGLTVFVVIVLLTCAVYVKHTLSAITLDGNTYDQVGLMAINNDGDQLYTPVFRKRSK